MAVQYNSKEDSWGGFVIDLIKAKQGIVEVSDEATAFFEKTKDWDFGFVKEKLNGNINETEKWIDKLELSDESLKDFLKTWDGSGDIAEAYQAHLKNSANSMTLFQRASKAAGTALKTLGAALGSMAAAWAIGEAISLVVSGIDHLVNSAKYAEEAAENFSTAYDSLQQECKNNSTQISELNMKYKELSQGVNSLGENVRNII